jgi:protein disulfide isomerase family A protein 3
MFRSLAVTLAFVVAFVSADAVLDLGDADFDATLEEHDTALVMFYAPWCGHCKKMKPEFQKAAAVLAANDPPVAMVQVDCTEAGKDTCGRFEVSGYPTVKIFRNGELSSDYKGPRESAGIIKFMKSQVGAASKDVSSPDDLVKVLAKPEVVVVSYSKDNEDVFLKVANGLRETVAFAHGAAGKEGIVLHRPKTLQSKFEPAELKYEGKMDKDSITKWVNENYHGLCGHRTPDNARDFKEPLVMAFFDVDYVKNVKGTNYWRNRIMKVAQNFKSLNFAIANENDFQQEASEFGLEVARTDKPLVAIKSATGKFVMEAEFDMKSFEAFLNDYENSKLEPYLKSEPVPENQGAVKVAVAKNFDELVTKSTKDVLIEFYAPWCGHCKKLVPTYDELGEKMADEEVEIVKMDATANDVPPGFNVRGFPTLFWYPKDTKKAVSYDGGRELADFVKYIAEKATDELKGLDRKGNVKKSEL